MATHPFRRAIAIAGLALPLLCAPLCQPAQAAEPSGFIGKNEWLFYRYEIAEPGDAADTAMSVKLLQKFNQMMAKNGVAVVLAIVPSKIRIYADQLPPGFKLNAYTEGKYDGIISQLRAGKANVVDLNRAFLTSPQRNGDNPLFLRLDTHWAPAGALLAAETIKSHIDASPALKAAYAATPEEKYVLAWGKQKIARKERDLVRQLPRDAPGFLAEHVLEYKSTRIGKTQAALLGSGDAVEITAIGSSYTDQRTGYPDALRYALQRDILDISIPVLQGPWVGMESYLRDPAFHTKRPKLIIWEIPEREMRSPPDYPFREPRYLRGNQEWLLGMAALARETCTPSSVTVKIVPQGLAAGTQPGLQQGKLNTGPTKDGDFVELAFDPPLQPLDYLEALVGNLDGNGIGFADPEHTGGKLLWPAAEEGGAQRIRTPLLMNKNGLGRVRILPGKGNGFALSEARVCRQGGDLLE